MTGTRERDAPEFMENSHWTAIMPTGPSASLRPGHTGPWSANCGPTPSTRNMVAVQAGERTAPQCHIPPLFLHVDSPRSASGGCWAPSSMTGLLGFKNASGRILSLFFFPKNKGISSIFFFSFATRKGRVGRTRGC